MSTHMLIKIQERVIRLHSNPGDDFCLSSTNDANLVSETYVASVNRNLRFCGKLISRIRPQQRFH